MRYRFEWICHRFQLNKTEKPLSFNFHHGRDSKKKRKKEEEEEEEEDGSRKSLTSAETRRWSGSLYRKGAELFVNGGLLRELLFEYAERLLAVPHLVRRERPPRRVGVGVERVEPRRCRRMDGRGGGRRHGEAGAGVGERGFCEE